MDLDYLLPSFLALLPNFHNGATPESAQVCVRAARPHLGTLQGCAPTLPG
jgi:hypothetical protein